MNSRVLRILAALFAATLLVSACSSGGGDSDNAENGDDDTSQEATGGDGSDIDLSRLAAGNCLDVVLEFSSAFQALGLAVGAQGSAEDALEDARNVFDAMAETAPSDIRGDFEVVAEEFEKLVRALAELDIDFESGETPTPEQFARLAQLTESIDQDALDEASDNIEAWFEEQCPDASG